MNEEKFTGKADLYDKYRPSYPKELIDWLYDKTKAETVADIGAGTGKFTKCLTAKPWKITAVEPNDDMRSKLSIEGVEVISAAAENTGLPDGSIDLVTAAQAFHWFDKDKFRTECRRILKSKGSLAVVFNESKDCDLVEERNEVFKKYCGACRASDIGGSKVKFDDLIKNSYFSHLDTFSTCNDSQVDADAFVGRELSNSYALKEGSRLFQEFKEELGKIFQKYQKDGIVTVKGITTCYLGKF